MKRNKIYLDFALVAATAALPVAPAAAQTGPEQTQRFLKTVEGTVKAIGASRAQLQKAVVTYNSITEMTAKDLKSAYKELAKDITDSEKKVSDGHLKVDEMNTAAAGYFAARNAALQAISDPDLRKRSEERLNATYAQFEKISTAGKDTRQSFDTLMTDAKDQYAFLGHDLNASAIASLKPDAAKFNARAAAVFAKVDGVTRMFDEYIASMKP
jgi:septal ring factor EnvC (AmiA/AmiB activator)